MAVALAACGGYEPGFGQIALASGMHFDDLSKGGATVVVLVYDPADCFVCFGPLAQWMDLRRLHPDLVKLVFSREPTTVEARRLRFYRIVPDEVFARSSRPRSLQTPTELVLADGEVVYQRALSPGQTESRLLNQFPIHDTDSLRTASGSVGRLEHE
ncbi:MAG TPA: hypothetical protein VGA37_04865 [Gemmatimonadales bacterium]